MFILALSVLGILIGLSLLACGKREFNGPTL